MTDLTTQQRSQFNGSPEPALTIELAKMLGLVAPITMSADQQTLWLASAGDALKDVRASELAEISAQVRRTVTRPSQIVPEISKLIAESRARRCELARIQREAAVPLIPVRKHIMDRDRRNFTAEDWAELSDHLEKLGSPVRYREDGTRYEVSKAA